MTQTTNREDQTVADTRKTAAEVIAAVMADVQGLGKHDVNRAQGFNFRGIDAVVNAVGPALRKHGGFIVPMLEETRADTVPTKNGGSLNVVRLKVGYTVFGQTGEPVYGVVAAEAFDSGDKATAKAMSVAYRTFLLQLLCLPTDEPDPDSFSYEIGTAADWDAALETATTREELLKLYSEAETGRAPKAVLAKIKAKGSSVGK